MSLCVDRPTIVAALVAAILAIGSRALAQPDTRQDDRRAIRAHIESIFQAFVNKDRPTLQQTHGQQWRGFTPWSSRPIRGIDGYMSEAVFPEGFPKDQGMLSYRISEFDVVFYGDTAVVSFVANLQQRMGQDTVHQTLNLLDVYHKDRAGWIQVASNTSLHPDELNRFGSQLRELDAAERASLMTAREAVWRAWFDGDVVRLGKLVPPELITIEDSSGQFGTRDSTLAGSRRSRELGARLVRLGFPRTQVQAYGNTAILYTTFEMDLSTAGQIETRKGTAVEVFVSRDGGWLNSGWQLSTAK
jgi:ketosteroid isomerase-like protein